MKNQYLLASKATFAAKNSWTKITAFLTMLFFVSFTINSQCENTSAYGNAVAPTTGSTTISTCNYLSEYSTITSVAASTGYICDVTIAGSSIGYVTIRDAANNPVAHGPAPLSWVSVAAGTYTAHWTVDALCTTAGGCHTTSITYVGTGCTNSSAYGSGTAPTSGVTTISTCNYLSEYSTISSVVGGTTYTLDIQNAGASTGYVTLRSGTPTGPLVALGNAPLTFTAPSSGTYYAHWTVDSACTQNSACNITSIEFINSGGAQCNGLPTAGQASGPTATVCSGFTLTTTGASSELGVDYQWQSSTNQTTWADIAGATDTTYAGTQTVATYYRMRVICTNSNDTSYTNDWFISQGGAGSVPYLEDLESLSPSGSLTSPQTQNCWTASPTTLFDWNIQTGQTGSTGTGPSGAYSGNNYFYVEASSGSAGSQADLLSPVIDLGATPINGLKLKFYYHMYGATMGNLFVQLDNGAGWVTVDSIIGQQQTSTTAPWELKLVDFSSYTGAVQVRFRAIRGTSFTGDISIDDIAIEVDTTSACGGTPTAGSAAGDTITNCSNFTVVTTGASSVTGVDYQWQSSLNQQVWTNVAGATDTSFTGSQTVDTWYRMMAICTFSNDTSYTNSWLVTMGSPATLPFFEDLESLTPTTALTTTSTCWTSDPGGATNLYDWNIDGLGSTPSGSTGPSGAYSGTNYFYVEASYGTTTSNADLYSPVIDLGATPTAGMELKFFYHMYGQSMGDLYVQVNDGSGWTTLDSLMGQQQTSATAPWEQRIVDLSTYSGNIQVRFRANKNATTFYGDMSLDDIIIEVDTCAYHQTTALTQTPTVCEGDTIYLFGSSTSAGAYSWSSSNDTNYVSSAANAIAVAGSTNETFYLTVTDSIGCSDDDSVSINVTPSALNTIYLTTVDSVVVNGQVYNQTGTYSQTLQSAAGCDSLLTINVLVNCASNVNAGADQAICDGDSATLTASSSGSALTSISWSNGSTTASITVSPTVTTSYIVTGVDSAACTSYDTVDVIVNTLPFVNAGLDSSFCAGDSLQLSATAYGTGGGGAGTTTMPAQSGTYSGNVRGYWFTAPTNFTITEVSVPTDASTGDMEFVILKLDGGIIPPTFPTTTTNYTIEAQGSGISALNYTLPTAVPVSAGDVIGILGYRNGVNSYGPSSTITINGQTAAIERFIHQGTLAAFNASSPVSANGTGSISRVNFSYTTGTPLASTSWSPSAGLSDTTITNPFCSASSTTTYTLTVVDSNGCSANDDVVIAVNATSTVDAGVDQTVCEGDTVTFIATATPATANYTWSNGVTGSQNVFVATNSSPYIVTAIDSGYCSSIDTVLLTVTPVDTTISSATGNDSVVVNGQVYTQSGTYYQTVTSSTGCDSILQIGVVVNCSSNISTSGNDTICEGGASVINTSGGSFTSYSWSNGQNGAIITVIPTVTTTYVVTAVDSSGCTSVDTAIVTVNQNPVVSAGQDLHLCGQFASDTLNGSVLNNSSFVSGQLASPGGSSNGSSGAYFNITNTSTQDVVITELVQGALNAAYTGSYSMNAYYYAGDYVPVLGSNVGWVQIATNANINVVQGSFAASAAIDIVDVTIPPGATYGFYVGTPTGSISYFTATGTAGVTTHMANSVIDVSTGHGGAFPSGTFNPRSWYGAINYQTGGLSSVNWSPSTALSNDTILNPVCSATSATTYALSVVDVNGCSGSDTMNVTYGNLAVNAGPDLTICEGDTVNLSVGGDSTNFFIWYSYPSGGGTPNTWSTQQISDTPNEDVFYSVNVSDANGCSGWDTVNVVVNDVTNGSTSATGVDSVVVNGQVYTQTGTYTQTLTNAAGCDSILTVTVELTFTGIGDETIGFVNVYPNPTRGSVRITGLENLSGIVDIRIVDNRGRLIHKLDVKETEVDLSSVTPGVYYLKISHAEGVGRIKLVKN